jgi:hypothetical protein
MQGMSATCYKSIHCRLTLYPSCTTSHTGLVITSEKCFLLSKNCSFAILLQSMYHKHSHQTLCKTFPHQQCHIKEYTEQRKNYKSRIQHCTKIKYKNWYFSWLMHGVLYVSMQIDQKKKKDVNIMKIHMHFTKFPLPHLRVQLVHTKS